MWIHTKDSKKYHFTPKSTQTLRDLCKILLHGIRNPLDYNCSIYAQVLPIEWAIFYKKSELTLCYNPVFRVSFYHRLDL